MRPNGGRGALIAAALCALVYGSATLDAQEPVVSAGGNLVEGQVLNETLSARRTLEVFRRPEREFLFPMFWKEPVPAGHVDRGEAVLVIGVGELRDPLILSYEPSKMNPFLNKRFALDNLKGGAL